MRVRILSSVTEVAQAAWNALLTPDDAPVLRWEWLHAMEASGSASPRRGWAPHHFTLWEGDTLRAAGTTTSAFAQASPGRELVGIDMASGEGRWRYRIPPSLTPAALGAAELDVRLAGGHVSLANACNDG